MKQKVWILLAVLLLLVATTLVRERFEPTSRIKSPPYDEAERDRIWNMMSPADQETMKSAARMQVGNSPPETVINQAKRIVANEVTNAYRFKYELETTPPTAASFSSDFPGLSSEASQAVRRLLIKYFVDQFDATQAQPATPPGGSAASTTTGTTTGGSSTTSRGPTSGTTGASGQRIFGPVFTARGQGGNMDGGDSTKTNTYPELMGGRGGAPPSTKIDGAGIVPPSKNWTLTNDGSLPSACSLGVDSMSAYFPFSRCPGDMDLIPDPYRVSRNFSTASYSSKTEPAPFLTDFSAFLK